MDTKELEDNFNKMIENLRQADEFEAAAKAEVLREYFTNPTFKEALEDFCYSQVK